mgnify:CR=1 FL=1
MSLPWWPEWAVADQFRLIAEKFSSMGNDVFAQKAKTRKKTAIRKKAASPPLGNELTSTEKSGELETASNDVSLARSRSQADIRPSSTASLAQRNSLTTMDTSEAGVLETR